MNAVWIIDDDRSIRWVLEKALGAGGHSLPEFSLGSAALDAANDENRRVPCRDIRMPGESGADP